MNILDYLDWRGDVTFDEKPINEVDNLIFSVLAYLEMDGILDAAGEKELTITALYESYAGLGPHPEPRFTDALPALRKMAIAPRFRDVRVRWYENDVNLDEQSQFSAVTFLYREDMAYVAFRGTDDTLIGWREDFNMSFLSETYGQRAAVAYLNRVASMAGEKLIVGGHSKGGNFAVYASAFCKPSVRDRIMKVYSNDGPGFRPEVTSSDEYIALMPKVEKLIPESSLVGILLDGMERCKFIRSDARFFAQHDPYTWCVKGPRIEEAPARSQLSILMDQTMTGWLRKLEEEKRKMLVDVFFDSLDATGASTVSEINSDPMGAYKAFFKALSKIDSDSKASLQLMLQKFITSGMDAVKAQTTNQMTNT